MTAGDQTEQEAAALSMTAAAVEVTSVGSDLLSLTTSFSCRLVPPTVIRRRQR